ncbi:helix-turn-helix transcriptional regulator [Acidisoma cellulosilytica]|uniref:Helix-turn-helix transcriptional regulator n=1 Tax=Acidisoma cellulosilyticum TaxID=2802395 RepID=A0A963Z604_9PROT|nr:AraC family transcriptional regulator [Acidisoma cellulosilyticum]MCB8882443.1 helix-turn-helix transcriptional regulator [Acidisoma cellulosilyticum]
MIENTKADRKYDRLTAFLRAYDLRVEVLAAGQMSADAQLFIARDPETGSARRVVLSMQGGTADADGIAAEVIFGGAVNPLLAALPERLVVDLEAGTAMRAIVDLFVAEACSPSCGGATVRSRLGEVIVVLAIRRAIDRGVGAGLLAGLAHPTLHRSLVAMHDDPGRAWTVAELAALAEMSRGHFIARFRDVVGQTPTAYLTAWRLTLGRQALLSDASVKTVAFRSGFGSAAAFSRAFSRQFGYAPKTVRENALEPRPA